MNILFHNESFPENICESDIYNFIESLEQLYKLHANCLQSFIGRDILYISTNQCKNNSSIILNHLFEKQKKVGKGKVDIIKAILLMMDKNVSSCSEEDFYSRLETGKSIVTNGYTDRLRCDDVIVRDINLKNISNFEQFEKHKFYLPIRIYELNPKHSILKEGYLEGKGTVSIMDLDDNTAQEVLNKAIQDGNKLYSCYDGKFYEFQNHRGNLWHGYCPDDGIPEKIKRKLMKGQ